MIEFYKYQGCGNDFIMIDNRDDGFQQDKVAFAKKWCDRRFGVGSDGLIFLESHAHYDFRMDFYNPDGSQSFCGNGSRCTMAFAKKVGAITDQAVFEAIDGEHDAKFTQAGVSVKMADIQGVDRIGEDYFLHTGSPHYISYETEAESRDIVVYGRSIRYADRFREEGTNVNLVKEINDREIGVLTYERGVEDETFACGTGATACGLSFGWKHQLSSGPVLVKVKGGDLVIHFERNGEQFSNIWLEGPADFVYKGEIDDDNH